MGSRISNVPGPERATGVLVARFATADAAAAAAAELGAVPGAADGAPPEVVLVGAQVIVHATGALPPALGELVRRRDGCVEAEIDRPREPVVATFELAIAGAEGDASTRSRIDALAAHLEPLLEPTMRPPSKRRRAPVRPVFQRVGAAGLRLHAVFDDLVLGLDSVARAARERGVEARVTLREADAGADDPLAALRASP